MTLPFKKRQEPGAIAPEPTGMETLFEGGLLASWYMEHRLAGELERGRRYGRPLTVLHGVPALLPGERLPDSLLQAGVIAAKTIRRATDLLGWGPERSLLIIMPETGLAAGEAGASRWQTDLYLKTQKAGAHKWKVCALDALQFERAEDLLATLGSAVQQNAA